MAIYSYEFHAYTFHPTSRVFKRFRVGGEAHEWDFVLFDAVGEPVTVSLLWVREHRVYQTFQLKSTFESILASI